MGQIRYIIAQGLVKKHILKSKWEFALRFINVFFNNGNSVVSIPVFNI